MDKKKGACPEWTFVLAFILLTSLVWCPWAYGTATGRTFSIPTWAVVAYGVAAALIVLEWVFLFVSGLAVTDDDLSRIVSELEALDASKKEGE